MAGSSAYHDEDPSGGAITDINVTPLVDVCLVLLIIFMVTAQLIHEQDRGPVCDLQAAGKSFQAIALQHPVPPIRCPANRTVTF